MKIVNRPSALVEQMQTWAKKNNATKLFINHASLYMDKAIIIGIDPVIAYVQYAIESNFGQFNKKGSLLDRSYMNPCGIRNLVDTKTKSSFSFKRFKSWDEGIDAHLDHLALLAGADEYPKNITSDPRHLPNLFNTCPTVDSLQNVWKSEKNYISTVKMYIKDIQNQAIETGNNISIVKDQVKVLKDRIQEKDLEIAKLKSENLAMSNKCKILLDESEEYKYKVEVAEKELNEYKHIINKIYEFMKK